MEPDDLAPLTTWQHIWGWGVAVLVCVLIVLFVGAVLWANVPFLRWLF